MRRSLAHPDALLATWFGAGLAPAAPGTVGSAAALPLGLAVAWLAGWPGLLVASAVVAVIGWRAADAYVTATGAPDPKEVVIDEVAAQLLVLAAAPFSLAGWIAGFLLFRLFDVWKPWPCNALDRSLKGGIGVMADDLAAGAYAALVLYALTELGAWP